MSASIIDGKKIAAKIKEDLKEEVLRLQREGVSPGLAVVLVGSDPASKIYVSSKKKACEEIGMESKVFELDENVPNDLEKLISEINKDEKISGVLVQLPLPKHLDEKKILELIAPRKDVDCFHPENVGKLSFGIGKLLPCTPAGVVELLEGSGIELFGKECVIVGKSNIVGKPLALMLMNRNATVTVCHSKTKDLKFHTKNADILISAAGKPGLITSDMVKSGAIVIDVGINRKSDGKLVGDVDFDEVKKIAGAITPVPGGVGPMTIAMLMKNTVEAAKGSNLRT